VSLVQNNQATLTVAHVAPQMTAGIGMPEGGPISADLPEAVIADSQQRISITSNRSARVTMKGSMAC
jgi:hypothetical protein